MNRAIARSSLKDNEGAIKDCTKAIQLDPFNDGRTCAGDHPV